MAAWTAVIGIVAAPAANALPRAATQLRRPADQEMKTIAQPSAPSGLANTTDPQVCSQHGGLGGGLACKALLPRGSLALVWTWSGGAAVEGFHIWRVDGGRRERVGVQPHNPGDGAIFTLSILDVVPPGGFGGTCYAVSAYGAAYAATSPTGDSVLSPEFCASGNSVIQTLVLSPQKWFSATKISNVTVTGSNTTVISNGLVQNAAPNVGNINFGSLSRTAILFDVSPISHRAIKSARLRLTVDTSTITANSGASSNLATNHYTSCIDKIGVAMDAGWQSYRDWIDTSIQASGRAQQGPDTAFDVTSIVNQWAQGDRNYGLVLLGEADSNVSDRSPQDADWTGVDPNQSQSACMTVYRPDNIQLEVQYQ